jgi:nicotinamide-nucleotide amidase
MKAEIVSIGTELLRGEITDTDAAYLASQLPLLGIDLVWVSEVGDDLVKLAEVLKRAWERSDVILTTGGLGPTDDDMTRGAIAAMLGEKMAIDPSLEQALRERFRLYKMEMPQTNLRQATLIPSARPIINPMGTAPGWWVEKDGRILISMPGPPRELQEMWQKQIQPKLRGYSPITILSRTIKTFGVSEAAIGEKVFPLFTTGNPSLGVYARADGIQVRLTAQSEDRKRAEKMIADGEAAIRAAVGDCIWGTDDDTLESVVADLLTQKNLSLAIMEDYSGGSLITGITDFMERASFLKGGLVTSSDEAKTAFGVDPAVISRYGAVSLEVAQAMAEAARTFLKTDIGIAVTGLQPVEGSPTGIVYIGITDGKGTRVVNRPRGKRRIAVAALFELRKMLVPPG